jgi:hypothetical protein
MVKNNIKFHEWENNYIKNNPLSYEQKIKIFDGLWSEAVNLGVISKKNSLDGIEKDIELKRRINCLKK